MFLIFRWLITWPHIQLLSSLLSPYAMLNLGTLRDNMMMINSTTETNRKRKQSLALHTPVNGPGSLLDVVWWAALCIGFSLFCFYFSQIIRVSRHSHYFRITVGAKQFTEASGVLAPWSMRFFLLLWKYKRWCSVFDSWEIRYFFFYKPVAIFRLSSWGRRIQDQTFLASWTSSLCMFQSIRPINTPSPSGKCMFAK